MAHDFLMDEEFLVNGDEAMVITSKMPRICLIRGENVTTLNGLDCVFAPANAIAAKWLKSLSLGDKIAGLKGEWKPLTPNAAAMATALDLKTLPVLAGNYVVVHKRDNKRRKHLSQEAVIVGGILN